MFEKDSLPKRVAKYSLVLSIKESYLLTKNWLGMYFHPFKTIRALIREKDYSQLLLVSTFPIYILLFGLFSIWFARRIVGITPGSWGAPTKLGVIVLLLTTSYLLLYLGYWIVQVIKTQKQHEPK